MKTATQLPSLSPEESDKLFYARGVPHKHLDKNGFFVDCYHSTKNVLVSSSFWIGVTFSFPIEHYLWEKVWPFSTIHTWMGL